MPRIIREAAKQLNLNSFISSLAVGMLIWLVSKADHINTQLIQLTEWRTDHQMVTDKQIGRIDRLEESHRQIGWLTSQTHSNTFRIIRIERNLGL